MPLLAAMTVMGRGRVLAVLFNPYPDYARYKGKGGVYDASNFRRESGSSK